MNILIDNKSGTPIYDQIYSQIKSQIISGELKQDEMLPFFMSVMKISKEKKISFTQEEMELILDVLKGNASKEDLTKINQLMQMRKVLS